MPTSTVATFDSRADNLSVALGGEAQSRERIDVLATFAPEIAYGLGNASGVSFALPGPAVRGTELVLGALDRIAGQLASQLLCLDLAR